MGTNTSFTKFLLVFDVSLSWMIGFHIAVERIGRI